MQDMVNDINKIKRAWSRPLFMGLKGELALQVAIYTRTLEVGFPHQIRRKIK